MSSLTNSYHTIIVGSSPLLLLKALQAAKCGYSVLVLDQDCQIGGSWKPFLYDGIPFEGACHLLSKSSSLKKILDPLSIQLSRVKRPICIVYKNKFYSLTNPFDKLRLRLVTYVHGNSSINPIRFLIFLLRETFQSFHGYYYFKSGSPHMLEQLFKLSTLCGADFKFGCCVSSIEKISNCYTVKLVDGRAFHSQYVFHGLGLLLPPDQASKYIISYFIRIPLSCTLPDFFYLKFIDTSYIKRFSSIGHTRDFKLFILESVEVDSPDPIEVRRCLTIF